MIKKKNDFNDFVTYYKMSPIITSNIKVDGDDILYSHFKNRENLRKLIHLYQLSNLECTRNGKLTPNVGYSREKDLVSSLIHNDNLRVHYNIDNNEKPDCIIDGRRVSIKHSSNAHPVGAGIKCVWTSNKDKQIQFAENFSFSCDLLIVWIRFEKNINNGKLEIVHIPKEILQRVHHLFQIENKKILKCLDNNSRGIEFMPEFFKAIMKKCVFSSIVSFRNVISNKMGSIESRLKILEIC